MELFLGFYFGILTAVALFNFQWYTLTKEKSYLYYAVFKCLMILLILQVTKIIVINQFILILNTTVLLVALFLFSKELLGLKDDFKAFNRIINSMILIVVLSFLYTASSGDYSIFDQPYSLVLSPLVVLGYFVYRSGFKPAIYFVASWSVALMLVGLNDLNVREIVSFYPSIPFGLIGHLVESVVLSYAIFLKTHLIIKEKEEQCEVLIHQSKLVALGQMLENIAHQWRQPLNRVSAFMVNMQVYISNKYKNEEYLIETLNQSQLQVEYMSNTLNDFTNFNNQTKEKEEFLISSVIDEVHNIIGQTLTNNNILFETKLEEDFPLYSYQSELTQVILNLIQNAQDELIKRASNNPTIKVVVHKNSISVQDNVGGIDAEVVNHIFDPYFTTKDKSSSSGLGLYMSKMILEKSFNADIEIKQSEQCTSFNIIF